MPESNYKSRPHASLRTLHTTQGLADDLFNAIDDLVTAAGHEMRMDEMHGDTHVTWLDLFCRMGEKEVDAAMERIGQALGAYGEYRNPSDDVPPGVPV